MSKASALRGLGLPGQQVVPPLGAWDTSNDLAPSLPPLVSGWGCQGAQPARPWGQKDIIAISQKRFCSSGQGWELRVVSLG